MMFFDFVNAFWVLTCKMATPLLFGFFAAGLISQFISVNFVMRHLGGRGIMQIIKASLFGIPLPLCSCSVLPVGESLRRFGISKGALTSFMISTPQTGIDSIVVTYGVLGGFFALFRPIAAFISGVFGGIAVNFFDKDPTDKIGENVISSEIGKDNDDGCECCKHEEYKVFKDDFFAKFANAMRYGFIVLPADMFLSLLVGFIAGAVIDILVPVSVFENIVGFGVFLEMVVMIIFGIPLYVCASASVPVAAVLIAKGISPGAAFVFLMTGPASNTVSFSFMYRMLGSKGLLIYLFTLIVFAIFSGYLINLFPLEVVLGETNHCGVGVKDGLTLYEQVSGVILIAILILSKIFINWRNLYISVGN